jgi:hypothetical protein
MLLGLKNAIFERQHVMEIGEFCLFFLANFTKIKFEPSLSS